MATRFLIFILILCLPVLGQNTVTWLESASSLPSLPPVSTRTYLITGTESTGLTLWKWNGSATNSTNSSVVKYTGSSVGRWFASPYTGSLTNVTLDGTTKYSGADSTLVPLLSETMAAIRYSISGDPTIGAALHSVPTVSALTNADHTLVSVYGTVTAQGYVTQGDGADGLFRKLVNSGQLDGPGLGGIYFPFAGTTNWILGRIWDGTVVRAAWFGAFPGDDTDDSPAIQQAIDYLESIGRGTVQFDGGVYDLDSTLLLKYRVNLIGAEGFKFGEGFSFDPTNSLYLTGGFTQFKIMDGANVDAVWAYATNGYVRQASETIEDGSVADSRFQDSLIRNIVFNGNSLNNTNEAMSAIRARNKWTLNIENCGFISWRGQFIDFWDVNASRIADIWAKGNGTTRGSRGLYVYSSADNIISGLYLGGFQGPAITLAGESTFKNLISDVISYNEFATNTVWAASSVDTNGVWTFASDVPLASGMPLELRTTGTLPSPFTDTQLYWAVKLTGTTFGIHTNYALATNGTYLACSGGSGTHSFTIGPATGLYLTYNSKYNTVVNYRADQMSGPGIMLRNTRGNAITALEVSENTGSANGEAVLDPAGIKLEKDADDNLITGTTSAQTYGAWVADDATRNQFMLATNNVTVAYTNASTGFNYTPALLRLDGYLGDVTTAEFGVAANGTTLTLNGGAGGVGMLRLVRSGTGTNSIGVGTGTITFREATQNRNIGALVTDGSSVNALRLGATSGQTSPRQGQVVAEDASGTNVAGANLTLRTGLGTGAASAPQIQFYGATPTSSGTTAQASRLLGSWQVDGDLSLDVSTATIRNTAAENALAPAFETLTSGTTVTWTMNLQRSVQNAHLTLSTNATLSISGIASGMTGVLIVQQDGSGGRTLTLSGGNHKVVNGGSGAITLTSTAGAFDVLSFTYNGTNYFWTYGKNFN